MGFDAIVLAGGGARRLGGADKAELVVGGVRLLDRVVAAVEGAERIVAAGWPRATQRPDVRWCREDPPDGGPVAGLAAALPLVTAPYVVTLAVDLPFVAPAVPALLAALTDAADAAEVAVLVDADGRRNLLAAAWRTDPLRRRLAAVAPNGAAVRELFAGADVIEVPDPDGYGRDCDTWAELSAAQAIPTTDGVN